MNVTLTNSLLGLWRRSPRFVSALAFSITLPLPILAQEEDDDDIFELSPFEVTTDSDVGYLSTNSTSGTSLNVAIKDLPMAVQVINQEQISDLGASNLEESLLYSAGVFTSDNEASSSIGATRGTQGGGSGDKSVSSAGQGARFANTVYIRGLSSPYQNRMGFRYGGLVVTTNSAIALGGLMDSANIERIEVVKGPNSLLYGVGVLTGIVNVIPERPLPEPRYEVSLKLGSYDFKRAQYDFTGPVVSDWVPGDLNWRIAGSYEDKGHWTDFRNDSTEYFVAQLEYAPTDWSRLFLEYQDGYTRYEGISSQWLYDDLGDASDTEFRNSFDEAYNWARHEGTIASLRPVDPDSFSVLDVIDEDGPTGESQAGWQLMDEAFQGGSRNEEYRITGPDTYAERDERNFIADLELIPQDGLLEGLSINIGAFLSEQETNEVTLQYGSTSVGSPLLFVSDELPRDEQLDAIYQSGGIYGVQMQDVVKDVFGLTLQPDPSIYSGDWILPAIADDVKLTEYWWRHDLVKSQSQQYRLRVVYNFEAEIFGQQTEHTFLAGYSYIRDDIDFPDGGIDRNNASANESQVDGITSPFNNDGLYYRSIANFEPIYFDGRNDNVSGHNTVRAGEAYLNQVIEQSGIYGVYQGKFFNDRLEVILGARQDTYNARQKTYKRANISDELLSELALESVTTQVRGIANNIAGGNSSIDADALAAELLADRTANDYYITAYYRDNIESGDQGYFGYANRGGPVDESYGIVPGSEFDVFDKDVRVTTGTFGASFDLTKDLTVYGVISEGISPNTSLRDGVGDIIPAEETLNRELGIKFDFMEGRISGNVSVFEIDRKNAIWDMDLAPAAAKWIDAASSPNRSSEWTAPTYDSETPTTYFVRGDYFKNYLGEVFGIDPEQLSFSSSGTSVQQTVVLADLDPSLPVLERLAIVQDVKTRTLIDSEFAERWNFQQPFNGNVQMEVVGIKADGLDDLVTMTLFDPETSEFITKDVSNMGILYAAFMDRQLDVTKNELLQEIHPIRYNRFSSSGQPQFNNNVDFSQSQGALVVFDETISGYEFELFLTPTENLQFVINYTHVEREANDTFNFTEWQNISGTDGQYVAPFTMLHREYGWESAGLQLAWVDYDDYTAAIANAGEGAVSIDSLAEGSVEMIDEDATDVTIAASEFGARNDAGEILVFVDRRGNVLNESNSALATDYQGLLNGVSLNFNPEDEFAIWSKYSFDSDHGILDGLSLNVGFKYIGSSRTSIAFNSVSPLNDLTITPEVGERLRFDFGASYDFVWQDVRWKLSLNVYDVFEDTYDVTTTTLGIPNPITGESVTKRTEKYYSPTTFRVGLSASF
jgi:outer membrane receptor protein involved in Fe transport